jgi:excisionase family DNA binding protein
MIIMELRFLDEMPDLLTVAELCGAIRVKRVTVYRWFDNGLESVRIGGVRRIPKDAFVRFIQTNSGFQVEGEE